GEDGKGSEGSGAGDRRLPGMSRGQVENAWIISRTGQRCGRTKERLRESPAGWLHIGSWRDGAEIVNGKEIAGVNRLIDSDVGGIIPSKIWTRSCNRIQRRNNVSACGE